MPLIFFKKYNNEKGIGLVELVAAVAIFSIVVITATGIFINALKAQKVTVAKQNIADNLRYIMEFMVKELRMAQINSADQSLTFTNGLGVKLTGSSSDISFTNLTGNNIEYSLSGDNKILLEEDSAGGQAISSEEILITDLKFTLNDWDLTAGPAPFITIFIKAKAKSGAGGEVEMQNSVSPRIY